MSVSRKVHQHIQQLHINQVISRLKIIFFFLPISVGFFEWGDDPQKTPKAENASLGYAEILNF